MFIAARFVIVAAVAALFGSFLLTGVPSWRGPQPVSAVGTSASATAQAESSPASTAEPETRSGTEAAEQGTTTTRPDILPGVDLVTETVEPGVYRVVSDGYRSLSRPASDEDMPLRSALDGSIVAGLDGSVWWFGPDGFFRLGDQVDHAWSEPYLEDRVMASDDLAVAPDGTLWRSRPGTDTLNAASFDGQAWTEQQGNRLTAGIEVQDDGSIWTAWRNRKTGRGKVGRLTEDGWKALPGRTPSIRDSASGWPFSVASQAQGDVWLVGDDLRRYRDEGWQRIPLPSGGGKVERAAVGPDGTLWIRLSSGVASVISILARFDGVDWVVYDRFSGIPGMGDHYQGFEGWFEVAADGSVWFNPIGDFARTGTECDGVANFDGESLAYYLRDTCIFGMDVAPDGSVWVQAGRWLVDQRLESGLIDTYLIRPGDRP